MDLSVLNGRGAIVTGGGSGISLAFVKLLFQAGCNVLIADLRLHSEAEEFINSIGSRSDLATKGSDGTRIAFHKTNVTVWKELENLFDVYKSEFGGVPYIVCCGAGLYEPTTKGWWDEKDDDDTYLLFRVNVFHPMKLCRIALRKWLGANAEGIICFISSTSAQKASIVTPLYQPSKHAISCFTRSMAPLQDLCGVRSCAVAPGLTASPMLFGSAATLKLFDPEKDTERLATPQAVAEGLMAVAMDREHYPPGTVLEVTGPNGRRVVNMLNDPGPAANTFLTGKTVGLQDVKAWIEKERAGSIS
ncbi:uncharacterized protein PV07_12433 [Cladophialophora immunda]|uniref:3-hydroxybutyrate dehydrogenase n=1 Tax=Cladophialophora immunda TaxID=569365 RepID=A0A0D2ABI1_9EURO|nr:uncharacterized protein PV07_12433 [Cladophialophora immunda]KIW22112.1 hypothetical protein PV07_12433 [Cladophialophora immunda]